MKTQLRVYLFAVAFLTLIANSFTTSAQVIVYLGTGTSYNTNTGYPAPYGQWYNNSRMQYIMTASELSGLGLTANCQITTIGFNNNSVAGVAAAPLVISIGHTSSTYFASSSFIALSSLSTKVNLSSYAPTTGWNIHNFSTAFYWDGTNNIVIDVYYGVVGMGYTYNALTYYTATSNNSSLAAWSDGSNMQNYATGSQYTQRANMRIGYIPANLNDIGISSLDSPVVWAAGSNRFVFSVRNMGSYTYTTADIGYQMDNNTPTLMTGFSFPTSLTPGQVYQVKTNMTISAGSHRIKMWVKNPNNGGQDANINNDTLISNICTGMSGNYTIGSSGNYPTIADAIAAISTCGVAGPITFTIQPGTYSGRIVIPPVYGMSATNTVTFTGANQSTCIITYNATSNVGRATILFNGADYFKFDNLTIENTSANYGTCFYFTGQANYNVISNCKIQVNTTSTNSYMVPIEAGSSESGIQTTGDNANYNRILNNTITGGYYGVMFFGTSTNVVCMGNEISGNTFTQQYYYGIFLYYERGADVKNNIVDIGSRNTSAYAIYRYYCQSSKVDGNKLYPGQYGIYVYLENYYSTGDSTFFMNNIITNFKNTSYQTGIYSYYNYNARIYNNSIWVNGSYANSYTYAAICLYYYNINAYVYNNILVSTGNTMLLTSYYHYGGPVTVDWNDYIYPNNGNYYFYEYSTYYTNLAGWKTAVNYIKAPHDAHSYDQRDAHFVSSTYPFDLHISSNFPKIPGILLQNVTTDVDKDARCPYESGLGADEATFPIQKPKAKFDIPDTICDGTPVVFMNYASAGEPKGHKWYIDGAYKGNTLNLNHTFSGVGAYVVKLVTSGCGGIDSFTKTVHVVTPPNPPKADFIADKNVVAVYEFIRLLDLSTGCPNTWEWSISPAVNINMDPTYSFNMPSSSSSSQNPEVYFMIPGSYKVTFKASNGNGMDSIVKDRYITVKATATMCNQFSETSLYGFLTDDFDGAGYQWPTTNTTCALTLLTCGDSLYLNFSEFNVFTSDYLRIYDGDNATTGTPLWDKSTLPKGWGNNMDINNALFKRHLVSKTGKLYIEWERIGHGSTTGYPTGGFVAEWTGFALSQKVPTASFICPDTVCLGTPVKFENTSTGDKMDFMWDYDAQQVNVSNNVDGEFNYDPGVYTQGYIDVVLVANNCAGSSEFRKSIYLDRPQKAPKADFTAGNFKPLAGVDEVQLTDMTNGCAEQWQWIITPSSFTFTGGTSIASQNPLVKFNDTVWYTIKLIASYNGFSDSIIKPNYIKPVTYCTPISVYLNPDIGMSRVKVSNLDNNTSIGDAVYTDYSPNKTIILDAQSQYVLQVERLTNFNAINWAAWIDYNIDGDYNDSGELIFQSPTIYSNQYIDTFTVFKKALLGTTRMRVGASYNSMTNTPCGPNQYGEYEDYKVYIRPDMTPPVITLTGSNTVKITRCQQYQDSGATAWDNVEGNITSKIVRTTQLNVNKAGTYIIYYNVADAQGNPATEIQRNVTVTEESVPPQLSLLGNTIDTVMVAPSGTYSDPGYTAVDTCSGIDTVQVIGNVDIKKVGEYTKTYTAIDKVGNKTSLTRKVVVLDLVPPTITLVGSPSIDIEVYSNYTDDGVVITDNYCTGLNATVTGKVDINTLGTYTLIYSVKDCNGNGPVSVSRTVKVIDTTVPLIKYSGSDTLTVEVFDNYVAPAYLATDNYWPTLTTTVTGTFFQTFPTGKTTITGFYNVTYKVTDGSGNSTSITFVVHVVDTQNPVITLQGLQTVNVCRYEVLNVANSAYTVTDNYDKTLTVTLGGSYVQDYLVNFNFGYYSLTYACKDASGNEADIEVRNVNVKDCQLSVKEGGIEEYVSLYPNPNQGMFTVEVNKGNSASVIVLNSVGQVVKEFKLQKTEMSKFDIDLSNQGDGIYMVRIMTDEGSVVKRVTVTK
jgi:parallel beta-helix repeat protein